MYVAFTGGGVSSPEQETKVGMEKAREPCAGGVDTKIPVEDPGLEVTVGMEMDTKIPVHIASSVVMEETELAEPDSNKSDGSDVWDYEQPLIKK